MGITGYSSQIERVRKIARLVQKCGFPIVIGGPGVSSSPERYLNMADILFIGEAELLWPRFIMDWRAGVHRNIYRQVTKPPMSTSPIPQWLSLGSQMSKYFFGPIQTTRGCPFLDRFGKGFKKLENYHQKELGEICTQAIDKAKGKFQPPQSPQPSVTSGVKKTPLADDILHAVEQELLCMKQRNDFNSIQFNP